MKKLIGSAFLFLAVSVLYSETVVRITANRVSILDSPSYQGQVIGQARRGEIYTLQGSQGEWYKILLPGRGTGWILATTGEIETGTPQPSRSLQRTTAPSHYHQAPASTFQTQPGYRESFSSEDYLLGKEQGKIDGSQRLDCCWMGAGTLFGCLGVGAAFVFPPSEEPSGLVTAGKSPSYQKGYRDGFIEGKREAMVKSALIGWGVWIAAVLAVVLVGGEGGY